MIKNLSDNIEDYDKKMLSNTFDLLKYIKSEVIKDGGLYRFYDDKYNLIVSESTQKKADKAFHKYIKKNESTVGTEPGDYRYYVRISFAIAKNQTLLFNKKKGGIMVYAHTYIAYINDRNGVNIELPDTLRDVKKNERGRVMINIFYRPSQLLKFKGSHIKKLVKSLFNRELPGAMDLYNVSTLKWFK